MKNIGFIICALISLSLLAQSDSTYQFRIIKDIQTTSVKNQGKSGTCWSFSTSSFLESELIRMGKPSIDLSEMHVVKYVYLNKAKNYVSRQGYANFGQGSLAHDLFNAVEEYGAIPENEYIGKTYEGNKHMHGEMFSVLEGMLNGVLLKKDKKLSVRWLDAVENVLDSYLGETPESFTFRNVSYTPQSFMKEFMGFDKSNYISFTSFTHKDYYKPFILDIPDNFSNGSFYNLPLNELKALLDYALELGFTLVWDCDVSEKSFSAKKGIAIIPELAWSEKTKEEKRQTCSVPEDEMSISPEFRQKEFESQNTTDDHLMHITGTVKDQNDKTYYIVKNSWGNKGLGNDGYVYVSEAYFLLKTISVSLHKDGVPKKTLKSISL